MNGQQQHPPGLLVEVVVRSEAGALLRIEQVDFTTVAGRRRIAEIAQWAMPRGYSLTTQRVQA